MLDGIKKRLLVLADGSSVHTQRWLEGLSITHCWEIYLISMNPNPTRAEIYIIPDLKEVFQICPTYIRASGGNYQYLLQLPSIIKTIWKVKPHAITSVYLSSYGLIGAMVKGKSKLLHFAVGTDVMVFPEQSLLHQQVLKYAIKRADFIVSASRTLSRKLEDQFGYSKDKILTQQYGVPDGVFNLNERKKIFDFVSNRAWIKNSNIDYFLHILRDLKSAGQTALVGHQVPGFEILGEEIMSAATSNPNCVVLGQLSYDKNIETVASSRFLVSLTTSDGAPLSVLEAMAVGTIPILSDTEPNREWVVHGQNGFLVPLNDPLAAKQILAQALNLDPISSRQFIKRNREIIFDRGLLSKNMRSVSAILNQLTS